MKRRESTDKLSIILFVVISITESLNRKVKRVMKTWPTANNA